MHPKPNSNRQREVDAAPPQTATTATSEWLDEYARTRIEEAEKRGAAPLKRKPLTAPKMVVSRDVMWQVARIALIIVALTAIGVRAVRGVRTSLTKEASLSPDAAVVSRDAGTLAVHTVPAGAEVVVDGQRRGVAPFTAVLPAGTHSLTIRHNGTERTVPFTLAAGAELRQYFELGGAGAEPKPEGRISVIADEPGGRVSIDGQYYGRAPITIDHLAATRHVVTITSEAGSVERTVDVAAGATASVVVTQPKAAATAGSAGGWVTIEAPFDVQLVERGEIVGVSATPKIMVSAGRHSVVLVSPTLGYQDSRTIDVPAGRVTTLRVTPPTAALSVNARPWAEVSIDGTAAGQTPLADVPVPIGTHRITFRHPELGERTQTVVVTRRGPNRATVDFTR